MGTYLNFQQHVSSLLVAPHNYGRRYSDPNPNTFISVGTYEDLYTKNSPETGTWYYLTDGEPDTWYNVLLTGAFVSSWITVNLYRGTSSTWSAYIDFKRG